MPFLGNTPANTFVSIAKQTITGNGGISYALSYPVTNGNEIDVFVNNVRQEPTVAYTASGSTITFTEAITVSDSVYVIFNGQAVGTIDAPAGAYLPTTGGTINGNVNAIGSVGIKVNANSGTPLLIGRVDSTNEGGEIGLTRASDNAIAWAIDVYGNTSTPSLRIIDNVAGAVRLNIDGSGRVTIPNHPFFHVTRSAGNVTAGNVINWNVIFENNGSYYNTSNGRFTAPVTGSYYFAFSVMSAGIDTTMDFAMRKNGTIDQRCVPYQAATGGAYNQITGVAVFNLSVNDYVDVIVNQGTMYGDNSSNGRHSMFCGYLIG